MNLIADIGNTVIKTAVFSGNEIIYEQQSDLTDEIIIDNLLKTFPVKKAIVCSVGLNAEEFIAKYIEKLEFMLIPDHATPIPLHNLYLTPETLGFDRLAAAVGAHTVFPHSNILVIDAGTAITIDFITEAGEFTGGNISPGIDIRFKALNAFTKHLPLIERDGETELAGKTTEEAIRSGVWNGVFYELDGYINAYKQKYENLKVILTGGDHKYFEKKFKNAIFVDSNLNLKGLNQILEYNAR